MLQDNKAEKKKNAKGDNNEKEIVTSEIEFVDNDTFNVICKVTQDDGTICNAKLRLDMRLYPGDDAKANPVGEARSDSNMQPFLPPPIGRISFSLNPFAMLSQLMGPALWNKIKAGICLVCCLALCIASIPMVASNLQSQFIMWLFGFK